jgi:molecular chaperone DnaK
MNVGIDIGTTNTVLTYTDKYGEIKIWNFNHGDSNALPSLVNIDKKNIYLGDTARIHNKLNAHTLVHSNFKTLLGSNKVLYIDDNKVEWTGEGFMNAFMEFILNIIRDKIGFSHINNLTITVPAHFNDMQRKYASYVADTERVNMVHIIDEPIAAVYYHIGQKQILENEIALIYDFGGGTFDSTLVTYNNDKLEILSKYGNNQLGGKNIDKILLAYFSDVFESKIGRFETWNNYLIQEVHQFIRQFKESISRSQEEIVEFSGMIKDRFIEISIAKSTFHSLVQSTINETIDIVNKCIDHAYLSNKIINKIILTGGSSNIESIPLSLKDSLGIPIHNIISDKLTEAVALGACIYSIKDEKTTFSAKIPSEYSNVCHYNLGVLSYDGKSNLPVIDLLIKKNSKLPAKAIQKYYTTSRRQNKISFYLVQYMDNKDEYEVIGNIEISDISMLREKYEIQLSIEYNNDGTITCHVFDVQTGLMRNLQVERLQHADKMLIQQRNAIKKYQLIG